LAKTATDALGAGAFDRVSSFQRLCDEHLDGSYRLARVILGNSAEAEDAVHDAVVTAWTKYSSLRDPARFEAWFHRIVVNTCRNRLKQTGRGRELPLESAKVPVAPDAIGAVHERERMSRAFGALEPDHRVVLALRYYRDLPVDEIASLTGVRSGTVKSRLHRAQQRMRAILTSEGSQ
jgi:RNA polymerase sigma-70 factor (ECF subfamily)